MHSRYSRSGQTFPEGPRQLMRSCAVLIALLMLCVGSWPAAASDTVKIATVHFGPKLQDVAANRARIVALTEEAAKNGAKIIVHTEMATSGYAFFSREEIAQVAEPIEGPTAAALGTIAQQFGVYVVVGLPTIAPDINQFFNSAILIAPDGKVAGVYHKRSTLLEASYNSIATGPIPTFSTPYGRLAIVICADLFYPQIPRLAAVGGADILVAPANVGVDLEFLKVRAYENNFAVVVANRYGTEGKGAKPESFSQETFAIPSPFPYDFSYGSRSAVVTSDGRVLSDFAQAKDAIGYAEVPIASEHVFPVVRRPELYALIGNDTLEPYTLTQMGLAKPTEFAAAAVDPGLGQRDLNGAVASIEAAFTAAQTKGWTLRLVVLSAGLFQTTDEASIQALSKIADTRNIDLVVPFQREDVSGTTPVSLLIAAKKGEAPGIYRYYRTHRLRNEPIKVTNRFFIIDRDYGRVAVLHGEDLIAPETSVVMAKMGVDVLAVSANSAETIMRSLWRSRTGDYVHVVVANGQGPEAIYLGGYQANPAQEEAEGLALMLLNTAHVRNKKEPRNLDVAPLLTKCGPHNC
jgi:predicted amidohydrolase